MAQAELIIRIWTHGRKKLPDELPEAFERHAEHVTAMLARGCLAGDICDERFNGWWEIKTE